MLLEPLDLSFPSVLNVLPLHFHRILEEAVARNQARDAQKVATTGRVLTNAAH